MRILLLGHGLSNDSVRKILEINHIVFDYLEEKEIKDYNYNIVIKAPFISYHNKSIKKLKNNGSLIITDFEFIYWIFNNYIISVTGTNGKSTVVSMLKDILPNFTLCGNIGYPVGDAVINEKSNKLIIESSSFELEGCIKFKPNIAVFLPITKAHLDHHKSEENYFNSKMKNAVNLNINDLVIYPYDDIKIKNYLEHINTKKLSYSLYNSNADIYLKDNLMFYKDFSFSLDLLWNKYDHNIINSMITILVSKYLNVSDSLLINTLKNFKGLNYRIERITDNIYNDSKSTNIYSTIEALKGFDNVRLICGGYEKYEDLNPLCLYLDKIKYVYVYGMNKDRIYNFFKNKNIKIKKFDTLEFATIEAFKYRKEDIILFSPFSASFDQFENYIKRGEKFSSIINELINKEE